MSRTGGKISRRKRAETKGAKTSYPLVAALDVGTTKIACMTGELGDDGRLTAISGVGNVPAEGMHKGVVVDLEKASASIRAAAAEAAAAAGAPVTDVFVGVAGSHVVSINRRVALDNPNEDNRVTQADRRQLLEMLKDVSMPPDLKLIHTLPREYILDGQDGIRRPVGMWAARVELSGHLVYGAITAIQNLVKSVENAGLAVDDIVLEPLASSQACLDDQELDSGVMLVDIGGGTTDVALFAQGRLVHTAVIPVGGNHISRDISVGLKVPFASAEAIKIEHGNAQSHLVEDIEMIKQVVAAGTPGERTVTFSRKYLARIIEARVTELFSLVLAQARDSGYLSSAAAGIVITGGSSQLEGICGLAANVTKFPARQGTPKTRFGAVDITSNPVYATAVGLLEYGSERVFAQGPNQTPEHSTATSGIWEEVLGKVKGWFQARKRA